MSLIVDVIIALVGGGLVGTIVNVVTSRRSRKAEGIKSYQDTINMLMESNSVLVEERTRLMRALSDIQAQIDNDNE
nr:MAG TPA: Peripherial benzodiazepine receptor associated protein [Caudoviricetes sp.]